MDNPYRALPATAFWRSGVAEKAPFGLSGLWRPKFPIRRTDQVITAGSCFAQHIGQALKTRGFNWFDAEPAPPGLPEPKVFSYGVFSFRTGNIYTTALLRQWLDWAASGTTSNEIWRNGNRFIDPFRPIIEPDGFASNEELLASRATALNAIRKALNADIFVFTLGLTEAWVNKRSGVVYPACPGTLAGAFDPADHMFKNYGFEEIHNDLKAAIEIARKVNPQIRFLLTVSPVPLTATASDQHVLVATMQSKSVLRAVAAEAAQMDNVDYFPSYEMITSPVFRGMYYAQNLRDVLPEGVSRVMDAFFADMHRAFPEQAPIQIALPENIPSDDPVCEEIALEAFNNA